jgi:hypothetical protein
MILTVTHVMPGPVMPAVSGEHPPSGSKPGAEAPPRV